MIVETGDPEYKLISFCWDIITSCQYRCTYCYALPWLKKPNDIENVDAYKRVLPRFKLRSMSNFKIEILGGEPMLHPNIDEILSELCDNEKCESVTLNTNAILPLNKIKDLSNKGLNVSPSYHPEFHSSPEKFLAKVKLIQDMGYNDDQLQVNINIHNDPKYISHYTRILEFCTEHNIYAGANYLFCTPTYKAKYTDDLFDEINEAVSGLNTLPRGWMVTNGRWPGVSKHRHPRAADVRLVNDDNDVYYKSMGQIRDDNLNKWKGFSCRAKFWQIDSNGHIKNECDDRPLDMFNKNIRECIKCPNETCGVCEVQYNYHKTSPGSPPPIN